MPGDSSTYLIFIYICIPGNSSTYLILVYMYAWWFFNLLNNYI